MKKIGICTLHYANNFGAILQAFSLQKVLESFGHNVEFIKLKEFEKQTGTANFESYEASKKNLKVCKEIYDPTKHKYDTIVIGSDELWNLNNRSFEHLDEYFGYNLNAEKIITYAPSADGATAEKIKETYGDGFNFSKINKLSARDNQTKQLVKELSGKEVPCVLDPTLLMKSFDPYVEYKNPELKNYIAIYGYSFSKEEQRKIKKFAKKENKKIYSLGFEQGWCDRLDANIFEFLGYVKNADYIITNTFHGLLFSTIFEKEFAVFSNNCSKVEDVISKFKIENRNALNVNDLSEVFKNKVNYTKFNSIKLENREKSIDYLKDAIG